MAPLPLLSGLPPLCPTPTCRACSVTFIPLIQQRKTCYHCGFSWCTDHLCVDHKALLPREGGGHDLKAVCLVCWPHVKMSSSTLEELAALPVKQLTSYLRAYGIPLPAGAIEKSQLATLIVRSVGPSRVQPPAREKFYRENSVPKDYVQQLDSTGQPVPRPSPAAEARAQPSASTGTTPRPTRPNERPSSTARPSPAPAPQRTTPRPAPRSAPVPAPSPRARPTAPTPARPSSDGAQLLGQLLAVQPEDALAAATARLSVGGLKAILNVSHVRHEGVLEKSELVGKVVFLVRAERDRLERQAERDREDALPSSLDARDEWEEVPQSLRDEWAADAVAAAVEAKPDDPRAAVDASIVNTTSGMEKLSTTPSAKPPVSARSSRRAECTVCLDGDATQAPLNCGHLCLCAACAELIMRSTRECPVCRSTIGLNGLLRVFV